MMRKTENSGKIGYFMSADEVKFRKPVFPGDTLFIHVEMLKARKNLGKATCKCLVNGDVVSEGILLFGIVDKCNLLPMARIHPTAVIDPTAHVGQTTQIGPYCIIGARRNPWGGMPSPQPCGDRGAHGDLGRE